MKALLMNYLFMVIHDHSHLFIKELLLLLSKCLTYVSSTKHLVNSNLFRYILTINELTTTNEVT
jgi:hypothetical protein